MKETTNKKEMIAIVDKAVAQTINDIRHSIAAITREGVAHRVKMYIEDEFDER